mgnify:CR=1 FL=1
MKILVITTPSLVYATYHKSVCFKEKLTGNRDEDERIISDARSCAFGYGVGLPSVQLSSKYIEDNINIFDYLEQIN